MQELFRCSWIEKSAKELTKLDDDIVTGFRGVTIL